MAVHTSGRARTDDPGFPGFRHVEHVRRCPTMNASPGPMHAIGGERARHPSRSLDGARPVDGRRTRLHRPDPRGRLREWRTGAIPGPRCDDRPRLHRCRRRGVDAPPGSADRPAPCRLRGAQLRRQLRADGATRGHPPRLRIRGLLRCRAGHPRPCPARPLAKRHRPVAVIGLLGAFLVRSASRLLLQDPAMFGLDHLPSNPFAIATDPAAFVALETASSAAIAALAVAIARCLPGDSSRAGRSCAASCGRSSSPASSP